MASDEPMRVLLVESDPQDARRLQGWLDRSIEPRFWVSHVSDLADANERTAAIAYDAVILDLSLPDGRGTDTVTLLREHAPDAAIVVLCDSDDAAAAADTVHQGAHEQLIKHDITAPGLAAAIARAVVRRQLAAGALKLAEHARCAVSRMRRLMHQLDHGVVLCNPQAVVEYCNAAAEDGLGVRVGDRLPEPFARMPRPARARVDATSADGSRRAFDVRVWSEPADGGVVLLLTRSDEPVGDSVPLARSTITQATLRAGLDCMGWRIERLRELLANAGANDANLRMSEAVALGDDLSRLLGDARRMVARNIAAPS